MHDDASSHSANATRQFWCEKNFWEKVDDLGPVVRKVASAIHRKKNFSRATERHKKQWHNESTLSKFWASKGVQRFVQSRPRTPERPSGWKPARQYWRRQFMLVAGSMRTIKRTYEMLFKLWDVMHTFLHLVESLKSKLYILWHWPLSLMWLFTLLG